MAQRSTCRISGETFEVSDLELSLRKRFDVEDLPAEKSIYRFQHLGSFWQHWNLHKRKCEKTQKNIVSVFSSFCPYPVWHKDEWTHSSNPPEAKYDASRLFFEQAWDLFKTCPIPHNVGIRNENCEYTDDWWNSKNCYLCHSGYACQDLRYCYRVIETQNSQFCVFTTHSQLCADTIHCENCFESVYLLNCKQVRNSSFLYDCRNCSDCMFCFNLRNKKYCFGNKQLSQQEYEKKKSEWDLRSIKTFEKAKDFFRQMMGKAAWHRALQIDNSEEAQGNYLNNTKNCKECFFFHDAEDCAHCVRGGIGVKSCLNFLSNGGNAELCFQTIGCGLDSYDIRNCFNAYNSKFCEYSAFLDRCEECFGCCGLVGKKYHIFNKPYSKESYQILKKKIVENMKKSGEYGTFFPGKFSPCPYNESWSSIYWPLTEKEQEVFGYRKNDAPDKTAYGGEKKEVPDKGSQELVDQIFWDKISEKPFQIQKSDIDFSEKLGIPLPYTHYIRRLQENFKWMYFEGELRETKCAQSGKTIQTSWPKEYDGRILCEEEYLKVIH